MMKLAAHHEMAVAGDPVIDGFSHRRKQREEKGDEVDLILGQGAASGAPPKKPTPASDDFDPGSGALC